MLVSANGIYVCGNIRRTYSSPAALPIETEMRTQRSGNLITTSNLATSGRGAMVERHIYAAILTDRSNQSVGQPRPPINCCASVCVCVCTCVHWQMTISYVKWQFNWFSARPVFAIVMKIVQICLPRLLHCNNEKYFIKTAPHINCIPLKEKERKKEGKYWQQIVNNNGKMLNGQRATATEIYGSNRSSTHMSRS